MTEVGKREPSNFSVFLFSALYISTLLLYSWENLFMELVMFMVRTIHTGMKLARTIKKISGPMLAFSRLFLSFLTKSAIEMAIFSETDLTLSWYWRKSTA